MKVLLVMPLGEQRGGAEQMMLTLLRRRTGRVSWHACFLEDGPMVAEVRSMGIEAAVIPAGRLREAHRYLRTVASIARLIRAVRADTVLSWMAKAHLYAGVAAALSRVPAVWWQHGVPDRSDWLSLLATRIPARWVGCSSAVSAEAQRNCFGGPPIRVVHPGVEETRFDPAGLTDPALVREELGIPRGRFVAGVVARLQRWKGIHVAVSATASLLRAGHDVHLLVVGGEHFSEPDYPAELRRLAEAGGIADRTTFTGLRKDVPQLMNAMDIVVHSSIAPEPFGITIVEAMAMGKPVVASRAGGPLEIVEDGKTGLLVEPGDAAALSAALATLIRDDRLRGALGRSALEACRARFMAGAMARGIEDRVLQTRSASVHVIGRCPELKKRYWSQ